MKQMRIPLYHVNAFSNKPFSGNPAAVCPLQAWLDDASLAKVAAENNLSETAFFVPQDNVYDLRWFTPRCEVKLCGHATLASAYVLLNVTKSECKSVHFRTRFSGSLSVSRDGEMLAMDFPALSTSFCERVPQDVIDALGRRPSSLLQADQMYIAVFESEAAVRGIRPDFVILEKLHPYTVAVTARGQESDFVSRYFAPSYGVPEDPVTGSSHCALAPYWAERLRKKQVYARQLSERGGELWCEVMGDRVILKGNAALTLQGELQV